MKILSLLLFILGVIWAYCCLGFLTAPFGLIWDAIKGKDNWGISWPHYLLFILLFLNSLSGYWIWWGWLHYFRKERYLGSSRKKFWSISLANHASWILLLPLVFGCISISESKPTNLAQTWSAGLLESGWVYLIWPTLICMLSLALLKETNGSNNAEVSAPSRQSPTA